MDDELRGIGDMARASGLSVSALRFYDRTGLLVPAVVDPVTGYRRYSADQVELAVLVAGMRRTGMPVAEIATVLERRSDPAAAQDVFDGHLRRLEEDLAGARRELRRLGGMFGSTWREPASWSTTKATVDVGTRELARTLDSVRFAVGNDPRRPELGGALVELGGSAVRVVATDCYRLAICEAPACPRTGVGARIVLPARSLDDVRELLHGESGAPDASAGTTLDIEDGRITVTAAGGQISARSTGDSYPDHRRLLREQTADHCFAVGATELRARLLRAPTHQVRREQDGAMTDVVVIAARPGPDLSFTAADDQSGPSGHGEPATVAVNRAFLLDALDVCEGAQLTFELGGPLSPVAIRMRDAEHFVSLLMPIRL